MSETAPTPEKDFLPEPGPPVVTEHDFFGKSYQAEVGFLPIKNAKGEVEAEIFYTAYTLKDAAPGRPLMFCFNGGPGSASVWLHLGAVGPKRVLMRPDGQMPDPPYRMEDNEHSWFHDFDLVFVDPVGTGYSRAATPALAEKFWGVEGDVDGLSEFIRLFLTRSKRWESPLYMVGESYGTTRVAGLSGKLIEMGIAFNGVVLVSAVLQFQTLDFTPGNDLPFALFLPTYAATAWFHKKAGARRSLSAFLREVEQFVHAEYLPALHQGDRLKNPRAMAEKLARYTGLSVDYMLLTNLRPRIFEFCRELCRPLTVGRLDSRFVGREAEGVASAMGNDPSMSAIRAPYTACMNALLRGPLGFETDRIYAVLGENGEELWKKWNWGSARHGFPDTAKELRDAMSKNPAMKVFVASGYYDLATPYFATEYTLDHMGIGPFRDRVTVDYYEAGHMMYIDEKMLVKLREDLVKWL